MPRLTLAPTKSNLLSLRHQLAFAEEGYELLEQKRQILVFELMRRMERARKLEAQVEQELALAFAALRDAELDAGGDAVDRASLGMARGHDIQVTGQALMGFMVPHATLSLAQDGRRPGVDGTPASLDPAADRFRTLLQELTELAELTAAVSRLAEQLRKTQRRCNALSRIFIPNFRFTIRYIAGALEERERESFVILKMVRDRVQSSRPTPPVTPDTV
jgi:V/A-type H+-transporting ATPase subunit D